MDYSQTTLLHLLKDYGIRRLLWSAETFVGLAAVCCVVFWPWPVTVESVAHMLQLAIEASAGLLAILIAGLAIVVSAADIEFLRFLSKSKVLYNIFLPYWVTAILWGICIGAGFVALALVESNQGGSVPETSSEVLLVFSFSYALVSTARLVGTTLRYMWYRVEYHKAVCPLLPGKGDVSEQE